MIILKLFAFCKYIGRIIAKLEQLDIMKDTLIFFTSDNGPESGSSGLATPFKDRKRSMMEGIYAKKKKNYTKKDMHIYLFLHRRYSGADYCRMGGQDTTLLYISHTR
mgnify:CR=1 FL=1